MSKQLTLSAALAAVSMMLLALATMHGVVGPEEGVPTAGGAPLFDIVAAR